MDPIQGIVDFNIDRRLKVFRAESEYDMLAEELQEFKAACEADDEYEMIDALCDLIVVATGAIYKLGYDPNDALIETVLEVTSRQGEYNPDTGKWEKDKAQDPMTLYKAVYYPVR